VEVIASKTGFYGQLREAGEVFEVPDNEPKSSWFAPKRKRGKSAPGEVEDAQQGEQQLV